MEEGELLLSVAVRLNRTESIILSKLDIPLTFRQYRTLTRVAAGCTSPSQLAAVSNLSLPAISENVDALVRRGLMTSTASTTDRRAVVLDVTEAGRRAAEDGRRAIGSFTEALLAGMPARRRAALDLSLREIYDTATEYLLELVGSAEN